MNVTEEVSSRMSALMDLLEGVLDFTGVLNTSIAASWLVLAIVALRFVLKRTPKWTRTVMWGMVAFRLLCPFQIESTLSLVPSAEVVPQEILRYEGEERNEAAYLDAVNNPVILHAMQPGMTENVKIELQQSVDRVQTQDVYMTLVWCGGMLGMCLYAGISYKRLLSKVQMAIRLRDNIFRSECVKEPFVTGLIRPRIYVPFQIAEEDMPYVIAHEQMHIERRDNWWKPLGFLLLAIHWFNPVMWLAYILFCRDIELACDEKVIKKLGRKERADYSKALLACSSNGKRIAVCPVAFGEVGVKERVENVLSYKKPGVLLVLAAIIAGMILAVCFLTNPVTVIEAEKNEGKVQTTGSGFSLVNNVNYNDGYSDTYITTFSVAIADMPECSIYIEQWYHGECMAGVPAVLASDTTELNVRMRSSLDKTSGEVTLWTDKFAGEWIERMQIPDAMVGWKYETYEDEKEILMEADGVILALMSFDNGGGTATGLLTELEKLKSTTGYAVVVRAVFTETVSNEQIEDDAIVENGAGNVGAVDLDLNGVIAISDEVKKAAYIDALEKIAYEHISPDNEQWSATGETKFAVYDIDLDGRDELLIYHDDGYVAGRGFYIYDYNEKKNMLYQELAVFPTLEFYENGMVEVLASHNHGMAPMGVQGDFWPYSLYRYNPKQDIYEYVLNVDAWEKEYKKAWTGESFQEKADIDGDGVLYYIMTDGEYNYDEPTDGAEYKKWRSSMLGEVLKMQIQFVELPNILPEAAA